MEKVVHGIDILKCPKHFHYQNHKIGSTGIKIDYTNTIRI